MFDTLAVSRTLVNAGIAPEHATAITDAIRQASDSGDHITRGDLRCEIAALESRLVDREARLTWRFAAALVAQTAAILTAVIGAAVTVARTLGS